MSGELKDVLAESTTFEGRVAALEDNLMTLDARYAERVARGLAALSLTGAMGALAAGLAGELTARGQAALYDPQVSWTGPEGGDVVATLRTLAATHGGRLGSRLLSAADSAPPSVRDGAVQALVDLVDTPDEDEAALAAVLAPLREVAFSSRQILGRQAAYTVREDDDLYSIAEHLYGDASRWRDVVETYRLDPPYVSRTPRSGCVSPGSRLVTGLSRIPDAEIGALGETMQLSAGGSGAAQEWDIVPSAGGGIATVSGLLCLATDCALRLATPLGDLAGYPRYGMPEIAGLPRNAHDAAQYLLAAQTLRQDPRVADVAASGRVSGLKLMSNVTVVPVGSETVTYA